MSIYIDDALPVVKYNGLNVLNTTVTLPATTTIGGSTVSALGVITSSSANALTVGLNGSTNPAFNVDSSTGSQAAGLNVVGATAAGTVAMAVISSGGAANLSINAKGTGTIAIANSSTGAVSVGAKMYSVRPFVAGTADVSLTAALSGGVWVGTKSSGNQTYTLPAASSAGLNFTVVCGDAGGEILVNPAGSDTLTIKASEGGAAIVTAGGTGIKNTAASNVVGDRIVLISDGGTNWWGISQSGTWASQ